MPTEPALRDNFVRFREGDASGHVESFFLKANAPEEPLAFWVKYTIFSPAGRPRDAVAETWAIFFDKRTGAHVAAKETFPIAEADLGRDRFRFVTPRARLEPNLARGKVRSAEHDLEWELAFTDGAEPFHLLPTDLLYEIDPIPRSKPVTPHPDSRFSGTFRVDGRDVTVRDWPGCQGHNWGRGHSYRVWTHVNAFRGEEGAFFEGATAQVRLGPFRTPNLTLVFLRYRGRDYDFRGVRHWLNGSVEVAPQRWSFVAESGEARLRGVFSCERRDMVGLVYQDPDGRKNHCLNSKVATARLELALRAGRGFEPIATLEAPERAALEVLIAEDERIDHGVRIRC